MASVAYTHVLQPLLRDSTELDAAHRRLRTGIQGRQWGVGSLNRAVVVMCASAWEAYVEQVLIESINVLRPAAPPLHQWAILNAQVRSDLGRFNNPIPSKVKQAFADSIGLIDVTIDWHWRNCTMVQAVNRLDEMMRLRHEVAHGTNPRPVIHNLYSKQLPHFVQKLALHTDRAVRSHITGVLGMPAPWP
jgi:hypothetical protein